MKIGFIGLGIMGRPMAKNLLRAGHALTVCDHHPEHVAELAAQHQGRVGHEPVEADWVGSVYTSDAADG